MKLADMTYEWQQEQLTKKLTLCTPQQQAVFHRLYPNGPSQEQMDWAYTQIENTLSKNAKAESRNPGNRIGLVLKKIGLWPW